MHLTSVVSSLLPKTVLPIFTVFPTIINQTESLIEVECLAAGVPEPVLSWLTASYTNVSHDPDDVSIFLKNFLFTLLPFPPSPLTEDLHCERDTLHN